MNEENNKNKTVEDLIGLVLLILVGYPITAWVFQTGWNWFILPMTGIQIGFWYALGLSSFTRYAATANISAKSDTSSLHQFIVICGYNALVLLIMWIAHNNL